MRVTARSGLGWLRAGVLLLVVVGSVAEAAHGALPFPSLGVGPGLFRDGAERKLSFQLDLFAGVDVRSDSVLGDIPLYPAFLGRGHLVLGAVDRLEPRVYGVLHSRALNAFSEDLAVGLGFAPSIPLGDERELAPAVFLHVSVANLVVLDLGMRSFTGPQDFSATLQVDLVLVLIHLLSNLRQN
jgi:hypothetical protein